MLKTPHWTCIGCHCFIADIDSKENVWCSQCCDYDRYVTDEEWKETEERERIEEKSW
jgi:hypothetical protein